MRPSEPLPLPGSPTRGTNTSSWWEHTTKLAANCCGTSWLIFLTFWVQQWVANMMDMATVSPLWTGRMNARCSQLPFDFTTTSPKTPFCRWRRKPKTWRAICVVWWLCGTLWRWWRRPIVIITGEPSHGTPWKKGFLRWALRRDNERQRCGLGSVKWNRPLRFSFWMWEGCLPHVIFMFIAVYLGCSYHRFYRFQIILDHFRSCKKLLRVGSTGLLYGCGTCKNWSFFFARTSRPCLMTPQKNLYFWCGLQEGVPEMAKRMLMEIKDMAEAYVPWLLWSS